jgi:hypothetical protein
MVPMEVQKIEWQSSLNVISAFSGICIAFGEVSHFFVREQHFAELFILRTYGSSPTCFASTSA